MQSSLLVLYPVKPKTILLPSHSFPPLHLLHANATPKKKQQLFCFHRHTEGTTKTVVEMLLRWGKLDHKPMTIRY
eukprot:c31865_g1_i1 orf=59-283(+)